MAQNGFNTMILFNNAVTIIKMTVLLEYWSDDNIISDIVVIH